MNETTVTLVGNAATGPISTETPMGIAVRFRLAVRARRWDREKEIWTDGPTSFYTVWSRRTLAANLSSSLDVGDPLVVHGRLRIKDETRDGQRWLSADVDALAVGHDLTRGTSAFRRVAKADPRLVEPAAVRAAHTEAGAPAGPPGWAAETPVSWAARGAPDGKRGRKPDGKPDGKPDREADRTGGEKVRAVS
ncbi:single-stranded DNA-binding protein [Streptomyces sp. NPDC048442]|uniref:single-stranded DNA-binding protein n=1 Tax=Streptomyces sp. NPDC048442 TaxID=3154823 RepID=UPI0034378DC1